MYWIFYYICSMNSIVPQDEQLTHSMDIKHIGEIQSFLQNDVNLLMEINDFLKATVKVQNLDEFVEFKDAMNIFLKRIFHKSLERKSDSFILAFDQANTSKYQQGNGEDPIEMRKNIRNLLKVKNKVYLQIISNAISFDILDSLLSDAEKSDIISIITSNILGFFDEVFINWLECMNGVDRESMSPWKEPIYGWLVGWKIAGYREFSNIKIDETKIAQINNPHIKWYLTSIGKLIQDGVYDYQSWVEAEIHESKVWQDQHSKQGFVSPMEDYIFPWFFIEPEVIFFLKDSRNPVLYSDFYNLASKYFDERYGMDHMTCTHVETILEWWDATYSGFIGKAFPNDVELSQKEWNNIILRSNPMRDVVSNAKIPMMKLFPWKDIDFDALRSELVREVTYHEFGHSLFIKWHWTSSLEEAKATLFYYLGLYDEHTLMTYSEENIERIVYFTIMDSIRSIERISLPESRKYVILMKSVLVPLFESWLVSIWDLWLLVDPNKEKFNIFLWSLKNLLFRIKELYTLDNDLREAQESTILSNQNQKAQPFIEYIIQQTKV